MKQMKTDNKTASCNINDWYAEEQENLRRFVEWWKEQALIDAKVFPLRMEYGDWTEQYTYFIEHREGN